MLQNVKVLDLSQYIPGPFAARQLADLGADVIKVEPPQGDPMRFFMHGGDQPSLIYQHLNRGKRIVELDLKQSDDRQQLIAGLQSADILIESFRPGVLDRLGFDRPFLQQLNPRLIHCAISGFGQTGPYRERAGHDLTYCAVAGLLSTRQPTDTPQKPATETAQRSAPQPIFPPLADHAGAMQASTAILAALYARHSTQQGTYLDISLCEAALSWQYLPLLDGHNDLSKALLSGQAACYHIYQTQDQRWLAVAPLEAKFWITFCTTLQRPDWIERQFEPFPQTALIAEVAELFKSHPLAYWQQRFQAVDCCLEAIPWLDQLDQQPPFHSRHALRVHEPQVPIWQDGQAIPTPPTLRFSPSSGLVWKTHSAM